MIVAAAAAFRRQSRAPDPAHAQTNHHYTRHHLLRLAAAGRQLHHDDGRPGRCGKEGEGGRFGLFCAAAAACRVTLCQHALSHQQKHTHTHSINEKGFTLIDLFAWGALGHALGFAVLAANSSNVIPGVHH